MMHSRRLALAFFISASSMLSTSTAVCLKKAVKEKTAERKHSAIVSHYAIPITAGIITGIATSQIARCLDGLHIFGNNAQGLQHALWLLVSFYGCNKIRNIVIEENVSQSDEARTNGLLATLLALIWCQCNGR